MVHFKDGKIIIEIQCPTNQNAIEMWSEIYVALCDVIRNPPDGGVQDDSFFHIPYLMRHLLPDWEHLKKMSEKAA
ncbi:MAG: hypothetical protein ACRCZB_02820 [Bacteroidales bacterium]